MLVVSPDYNVIQDTTWPTFQRVAEQTGQWLHGVQSPTPRAWFRPVGGGTPCLVVFRSAEKPDKLRGGSWALIWFDEASIMCHEAFTFSIPALRWRGREGTILVTMTPKGVNSWTFSLFFEEIDEAEREILEDEDRWNLLDDPARYRQINNRWYRQRDNTGIVQAHSRENPFLPASYEHDIGIHLSNALKQQELAGEFIELAGLYFQRGWFEIKDAVPRVAQRVRYWDRASTHGGGCFSAGVLMARTDNGLFWVEDVQRGQWSYEERNAEIVRIARQDAMEYGNEVQIWGEQEGGSAGKEVSQQFVKMLAGYPVHIDIVTGKGTRVLDGIEVPHKPKLVRAQGLIAQSEAKNVKLKRAKWNSEFLDELCSFGQSDIMDQCVAEGTMIATASGEVPIEEIGPSDFIWTRQGLFPILRAWCTGEHSQTYAVDLDDGTAIEATSNHPVWIEGAGWQKIQAIDVGASLSLLCWKPLSWTGSSGGDTQTQRPKNTDGTLRRPLETSWSNSIATFGKHASAPSRKGTLSTTETGMPLITTSRILSASRTQNTADYMQSTETSAPQPSWKPWQKRRSLAAPGMQRKQGKSFTSTTGHTPQAAKNQSSRFASTAENRLCGTRTPSGLFVLSTAETSPTGYAIQRHTSERTSPRHANSVDATTRPQTSGFGFVLKAVRVSRIGPSAVQPVWNLTVDGPPEYFANGILVHNCDAASGAFNKLCRMWTTDPGHTFRIEPQVDGERFGVHLDKGGRSGRRRV